MPDFLTGRLSTGEPARVYLQPGAAAYPLNATFPVASAAHANDGAIPYGKTITTATAVITDEAGTEVTDQILVDG